MLSVDNDQRLLRPGMTATATIIVERQTDALLVPMAALRYAPPVASDDRSGSGLLGLILPSRPGGERGRADGKSIWVLRGDQPVKIAVTPGASDGRMIAVAAADLSDGDAVITSQRVAE